MVIQFLSLGVTAEALRTKLEIGIFSGGGGQFRPNSNVEWDGPREPFLHG